MRLALSLAALVVCSTLLGACGEDDPAPAPNTGAGSGGTGGSAAAAGSSGTGGTAGGASNPVCNLATPAVLSCPTARSNGVGSCTESAQPSGAFEQVCGADNLKRDTSCPTDGDLFGICVGGITTYYYEPAGGVIWSTLPKTCPANGGTWCPRR